VGLWEWLPYTEVVSDMAGVVCGQIPILCSSIVELICDKGNKAYDNLDRFSTIFLYEPAGSSIM